MMLALVVSQAAGAQTGSSGSPGFLANLLGIRPATTEAPMNLAAPPPAGKAARTSQQSASPAPAKAGTAKAVAAKADTAAPPVPRSAGKAADTRTAAAGTIDPKPSDPGADLDRPVRKPVKLPPFRGGGSQAVCVRTCDGFFFPVNYEGAHGSDRYAEACQLACPSAPTEVYFMPRGGDLKQAANQYGQRYAALPNAFKYRKERDASCACKAQNQSWGEVLAHVEPMIKQGKDDILVTPERSLELARPADPAEKIVAEAAAPRKAAKSKKAGKPAIADAKPALRTSIKPDQAATRPAPARPVASRQPIDPETTASIRRAAVPLPPAR